MSKLEVWTFSTYDVSVCWQQKDPTGSGHRAGAAKPKEPEHGKVVFNITEKLAFYWTQRGKWHRFIITSMSVCVKENEKCINCKVKNTGVGRRKRNLQSGQTADIMYIPLWFFYDLFMFYFHPDTKP